MEEAGVLTMKSSSPCHTSGEGRLQECQSSRLTSEGEGHSLLTAVLQNWDSR
jgi:hypothetical protein